MRPERVLIVGGGLAGCALAESFSRRGVQVLVLERHERLGGAVASLPLIAQHPALTPDFDLRSRLLLRAMQLHASLRAGPARDLQPAFEVCGRLQPMTRERAERCIAHVPPGVACLAGMDDRARLRQATSARQAASAAGGHAGDGCRATAGIDGVFFPECAAVSPRRWWDAVLARPGVECRLGVRVGRIEPQGPDDLPASASASASASAGAGAGAGAGGLRANGWRGWQVFSPEGRWLASADLLVLACREEAFSLAGMTEADHGRLRISAARVWTARADGGPPDEDPGFPALLPIAGGQGLALTRPGSFWLRSEERYQSWLQTGRWADDDSLSRMSVFLPGSHAPGESQDSTMSSAGFGFSYGDGLPENEATALAEFLGQPGSWHASAVGDRLQCRDNLPMIGPAPDLVRIAETADELARNDRLPMPRRAGLYLLTALAGRGSLYAALGAEMIAAHAFGEPAVVDDALVRAVDPARFIKRRLQRAWSQRLVAG